MCSVGGNFRKRWGAFGVYEIYFTVKEVPRCAGMINSSKTANKETKTHAIRHGVEGNI